MDDSHNWISTASAVEIAVYLGKTPILFFYFIFFFFFFFFFFFALLKLAKRAQNDWEICIS